MERIVTSNKQFVTAGWKQTYKQHYDCDQLYGFDKRHAKVMTSQSMNAARSAMTIRLAPAVAWRHCRPYHSSLYQAAQSTNMFTTLSISHVRHYGQVLYR